MENETHMFIKKVRGFIDNVLKDLSVRERETSKKQTMVWVIRIHFRRSSVLLLFVVVLESRVMDSKNTQQRLTKKRSGGEWKGSWRVAGWKLNTRPEMLISQVDKGTVSVAQGQTAKGWVVMWIQEDLVPHYGGTRIRIKTQGKQG